MFKIGPLACLAIPVHFSSMLSGGYENCWQSTSGLNLKHTFLDRLFTIVISVTYIIYLLLHSTLEWTSHQIDHFTNYLILLLMIYNYTSQIYNRKPLSYVNTFDGSDTVVTANYDSKMHDISNLSYRITKVTTGGNPSGTTDHL